MIYVKAKNFVNILAFGIVLILNLERPDAINSTRILTSQ